MSTTADETLVRPAPPTMASPSWWGADSDRHRVLTTTPGTPGRFVKVLRPAAIGYVDVETSFRASSAAGAAGLGPRVLDADPATRTLVTEDLTASTRTATLDAFTDPDVVARYLDVRRAVQHLDVAGARTASVFDDVRALRAAARERGAALPPDLPWMLRVLDDAEARIRAQGIDTAFCHGDGNVSNVLLGDAGDVLLVDFDVSAVMDPLQDLGCALAELAPSDDDARPLFERGWGSWDAALFDRARVYGAADCVRWGLVGAHVDSVDPGTLEYSKFSDWQFLRARWALGATRFDDRLRNL